MWHWLPNLQLKRHKYFWLQLALFSFLGHIVLLLIALLSQKRSNVNLTVFARPRAVEVVFMPLYKKIPAKTAQQSLNSAKKAIKSLPVKQVAAKKNGKSKIEPKKKIEKKISKEKKPDKKIIPKKPDLKLKEQIVKIKPVTQPLPVPEVIAPIQSEPIYVGRQDLKDLQMFSELQAILLQNWQPPVGFGADVECVVELVVGLEGEIVSLEIKKSSNILAYDLSVRRNFNGMTLPVSAANKTFTIVFKP